jgi:DedD protein
MKQGGREVILGRNQAVVIFGVAIVFIMAAFVLGVLFGKNMAGRSGAREQSRAAAEALSPEIPVPLPSTTQAETVLAQGETAIQQKIAEQKPPVELSKAAKGETVKPPAAQTTKTTETVKPPATKPSDAKPAETKPKETAPVTPKEAWLIQVASFPDKATADQRVAELKAGKWPAYDVPAEVPGKGTYYRVYLGTYTSQEQASKALIIFKSKETKYKDAFVTKK